MFYLSPTRLVGFHRVCHVWIASFTVNVPIVLVLVTEAHVKAPVVVSVILAEVALKLGTYVFLRFSMPMFCDATLCSTPFIYLYVADRS